MKRFCRNCDIVEIKGRGRKYCILCSVIVNRQNKKRSLIKQNEDRRKENRKGKICKICKIDMSNIDKGYVRLYCSDKCAKEAMREQIKGSYWRDVNKSRDKNTRYMYDKRYGIISIRFYVYVFTLWLTDATALCLVSRFI